MRIESLTIALNKNTGSLGRVTLYSTLVSQVVGWFVPKCLITCDMERITDISFRSTINNLFRTPKFISPVPSGIAVDKEWFPGS
jgi:hypothetical protein